MRLLAALVLLPLLASGCTNDASPTSATDPERTLTSGPSTPSQTAPSSPTNPSTPAPPSSPSSPSDTAMQPPSYDVTYAGDGVFVEKPGQADLLVGAPDDFKTFVAGLARKAQQAGQACPDAAHGITVQRILGYYALGAVNDCGGYGAIWSSRDGAWAEILGTQEGWQCKDLDTYDVPHRLVGACMG